MRDHEEIISSLTNNPNVSRPLLCIFAKLYLHCELISKGVRHIAIMTIPWDKKRHQQWYPVIKELGAGWDVCVKLNSRDNKLFDYYIYSKGHLREVNQIIALSRRIQLTPKGDRQQTYPLHRQIGHLLGYSKEVVDTAYPRNRKVTG